MRIRRSFKRWVRGLVLLGTVALVLSACAATSQVAANPYPYPYGTYAEPPPYDWTGLYGNDWYLGDGYYYGGWRHPWAGRHHWGHGVAHFGGGRIGGGRIGGGHIGGGRR